MISSCHPQNRSLPARRGLLLAAVTCAVGRSIAAADGAPASESNGDPLISQMRNLAAQTIVTVVVDDQEQDATLVEQPVFRYSDPPRRFEDATLWVWTDHSRPVAMQKVEAVADVVTGKPMWQFCLTSLSSEGLIHAQWPEQEFLSAETGLRFKPVHATPPPSSSSAGRLRQIRTLARRFAATIIDKPPGGDVRQELRLLPRPIYTYAEPDSEQPAGAVIGFAANGTNPDALLVLDAHAGDGGALQWHFAPARMTTGGLEFRFDDQEVWSVEWVRPRPGYNFDRWIHFKFPREPVADRTPQNPEPGVPAER